MIVFLVDNHIYAVCYIYNIKFLFFAVISRSQSRDEWPKVYDENGQVSFCTVVSRIF